MGMLNKKLKATLFIFLILFCIAAVNAEEIDDNIDLESIKTMNVESVNDKILAIDDSNEEVGNFSALNKTINSENIGEEINLNMNYTYNENTDIAFKSGININKTMTINGNGHAINGKNTARIFSIKNGVTLILKNIKIINANGAIYNQGNLTVNNTTFNNNSGGSGAAINNNYGNLTIINSNFTNNTANVDGGAIYSLGNVIIINSTFDNNKEMMANMNCYGGAISSMGNLTVINSLFTNNMAINPDYPDLNQTFTDGWSPRYGGAISSRGYLTIINSTFENNSAPDGGAIYSSGHLTIINSTFEKNLAIRGGAISTSNTIINISNSKFNENFASAESGVLWALGNLTIKDSNFTNNIGRLMSGAINIRGNSTLINSNFINNNANIGGVIIVEPNEDGNSDFKCINSTFINNTAVVGGVIVGFINPIIASISLNMTESIFMGNNATKGGVIFSSIDTIINNCEFVENNATKGGAIYFSDIFNFYIDYYRAATPYYTQEFIEQYIKEMEKEWQELSELYKSSMIIMSSNFKDNHGDYGDDIYTMQNTTVKNNNYTENSYANIYANNTIVNTTIVDILANMTNNTLYITSPDSRFLLNATVFADGASIAGYELTITDGKNNYTAIYKGYGLYEIADKIYANFMKRSYTAIINSMPNHPFYIVENGTVINNKKNVTVNVELDEVTHGKNITGNVTITNEDGNVVNVTGEVIVEVDGNNYTVNITEGKGELDIPNYLQPGNYTLNATFTGTEEYNPSNTTVDFEVSKGNPDLDVNIKDVEGNLTMNIIMNPDINGNVTVTIDNDTFVVEIRNGSGSLDLSDLESGAHNFTVSFEGDDNYNPAETVGEFDTNGIVLEVDYLTKYYGNGEKLNIRLRDALGNPIANQNITIKINGVKYTRTTDENGTILMSINLIPGVYETEVSYENMTEIVNVTILSTIEANDLIKYFKNGSQYYAKFLDVDGTPLANTNVTFNIHGVFYTRTTDADGIAKLNINLNPGEYIITAWNPVNTESKSNIITVLSTIFGQNVVKFYRNGTQYYARVLDANGTPLANSNVTFNIHGVFYNRTSNEEGIVKLNINLNPGEYIITAWNLWNGEAKSNNITVYNVVLSKDLEMTTQARKPFKVTILGEQGKPLANAKVSFNIHGVFYHKTTDANGEVSLNINLVAGKYIITTYYNEYAVSNTIVVK